MFNCKLGNIAIIKNGKCNRQDAVLNGKYPLFDRSQVTKASNEYLFDCSAIIVPGEGKEFIPRFYQGKFNLHQRCYCIQSKNNDQVSIKYLYYNILFNQDYFARVAVGSTVPSLRLGSFENMELKIHTPTEQRHIVDTIGSVDDLIENYEVRISFLQKISSYLYLQLIEHSRETSYLGNFIKIETGSMNLDENDPNGRYPFYTRNIGTFYSNKYTNEGKGAVVAGEGNFTPKFVNGKFGLHQRAYFIQPSTTKLGSEVIYEIILSHKKYLESVAVGSTVKSLRRFCFEQMPFFIDADYFCLNQILEILFGEIENLKKRKSILLNQKSILLDKYF